jgi:hypothetical protein
MPRKRRTKDASQKAVALLAKVTKTPVPKGEDLLGSEELKRELAKVKARHRP